MVEFAPPYPRATATANPLPLTTMSSAPNQSGIRMRVSGVSGESSVAKCLMSAKVATGPGIVQAQTREQYARKCATAVQKTALLELSAVPQPLTRGTVVRHLCWSETEARDWLAEFAARGQLVVVGRGHYWTDAGRAEIGELLESAPRRVGGGRE